ncbi:hypothetical protein D4765_18775 [Subtercola vilae]|uniref:Uncharacterized protein n=1 Tax=Subtercola vilae TaxID=2056433 RepID=A0A4T2BC38_9MICO|nr:hypothetical protein D4765_18775 [Subtercola vilae]
MSTVDENTPDALSVPAVTPFQAFRAREVKRGKKTAQSGDSGSAETCTCTYTDPKYWTTYGSATEPGSMMEPEPDCPVHFPPTPVTTNTKEG